jgi:hypothetical protein
MAGMPPILGIPGEPAVTGVGDVGGVLPPIPAIPAIAGVGDPLGVNVGGGLPAAELAELNAGPIPAENVEATVERVDRAEATPGKFPDPRPSGPTHPFTPGRSAQILQRAVSIATR